jgi:ADP-ribose pyrophosphatase YjhB (NUDIX family)
VKIQGWLIDEHWKKIQRRVPVTCVDVLPITESVSGGIELGLIYRDTPHQGRRWCLIGGRLFRNEPFRRAVLRQVHDALGSGVRCVVNKAIQPLFVAEYFSQRLKGSLFDPRQHAVGLIFTVNIRGIISTSGETLDFRWFNSHELPIPRLFGFGQYRVVTECASRLKERRR